MESTQHSIGLNNNVTRMLGITIMGKACLPIFIFLFLLIALWKIASGVITTVNHTKSVIEPQLAQASLAIDAIHKEGSRLADEVNKIKNTTTKVSGQVRQSVEPIRKSLLGLSGAMKTISETIEHILNAIIKVVRKIPYTGKINYVNLPNIKVPGLKLPNIDIDLDLEPDLSAVKNLGTLSEKIATNAETSVSNIKTTITTSWWMMVVAFWLVVLWVVLSLVGYTARSWKRFTIGWQLVMGKNVNHCLQYL